MQVWSNFHIPQSQRRDHSAMPVGGKLLLKGGEALTVEKKIKKKKKAQAEAPAEGEEGGSQTWTNHACA